MHERDAKAAEQTAQADAAARAAAPPAAIALQRAVGNRAMAQALQRMETNEAVEALEKSMAAGTIGGEHVVANTLASFSMDAGGYDKVAIEYQKKTKLTMQPAVDSLPPGDLGDRARGSRAPGFFPTISGEKYPETPSG
jgi:hypothetical protein